MLFVSIEPRYMLNQAYYSSCDEDLVSIHRNVVRGQLRLVSAFYKRLFSHS